ncbi:MAG TPA: DUF393 domain-containing protein [Polyangia bacterium]
MTKLGSAALPFDVEVFYDGDCPLCRREVGWLRRWDRRGRIRFSDIAAPTFDPAVTGLPIETLMARIHARTNEGRMVEGVEVFRRLYGAVGFGPLVALTRLPGISHLLDVAYRWFARNRLRLTGRCDDQRCFRSDHSQIHRSA